MRARPLPLVLGALALAAPVRAEADASEVGAADPRIPLICQAVGKRPRPALAGGTAQVSNGIVYEEQVSADHTRLELRWRPLGESRWTGRAVIPSDLEQCQPLLLEADGIVAACRPQEAEGQVATGRRLLRLRPGQEPVLLAQALPLPGAAHLHPLGDGRLLVWAEARERSPGEPPGDELTAAEVDGSGRVLHQSIVSRPYVRRWPAGLGFVLLRQPPVGSKEPASYWRAEWDPAAHRLVFAPEEPPARPEICGTGPEAEDRAPARLMLKGQGSWTALVRRQPVKAGGCLAAIDGVLSPDGGLASLRAEGDRLNGRLWIVKSVARSHPKGGVRRVPQITAVPVSCALESPQTR